MYSYYNSYDFKVKMIKNIHKIIVCTDNIKIKKLVESYGVKSVILIKHKMGQNVLPRYQNY